MHGTALVAHDVQHTAILKEAFKKVDHIINVIRASPARQCKWKRIVKELKSEKALDKKCPVKLLQVRINCELFFNQDLPPPVLFDKKAYSLRVHQALSASAAGSEALPQHGIGVRVSTAG